MGNTNNNLHKAKKVKDDEFYTTYETIEQELFHYVDHFVGKTVLCNCDDPFHSNFCKFFLNNFNSFKLKRFICTSYSKEQKIQPTLFDFDTQIQNDESGCGYILDVESVDEHDVSALLSNVHKLKGDGDFRSTECLAYLQESDIVVTNPPFSLFSDFVATMIKYGKKFLVIGNQNAITYKDIFPLIQGNLIWTGYNYGEMKFRVPNDSEPRETRYWVDESGQKWRSLGNVMWFTNLDNERRHRKLPLTQKYDLQLHRRYDNYDAIHVRNICEIPYDYSGLMAVPLTIVNMYNSEQFEIVGEANHGSDNEFDLFKPIMDGKEKFKRILIRNRSLV